MIEEVGIAPSPGADRVQLKAGVRRVRRSGGILLLPPAGHPVMVSPLVDEIWDELAAGAQVADLAARLRERHPRARDIPLKLSLFLHHLRNAGLLEGTGGSTSASRRRIEIPIDSLARPCGSLLRRLPAPLVGALVVAAAGISSSGLLLLLARQDHPRLRHLPGHLTLAGVFVILFGLIPLHELGHAIACRWAGVAAGSAGFRFGRLRIPRPYVETPLAWGIEDASRRFWVPASGPLVDLLAGGAAAWFVLAFSSGSALGEVAWLVALYSLIAVNVGTSPIPVGDGSHSLEALLDDEFARAAAFYRRPSRFVRPRSVCIYRLVSLAHLIASAVLFYLVR